MSQRSRSASQVIILTSELKRMWDRSRKTSATFSRYARMCSCPEKVRGQSAFGAKENEYRWDGTSQAQPG